MEDLTVLDNEPTEPKTATMHELAALALLEGFEPIRDETGSAIGAKF